MDIKSVAKVLNIKGYGRNRLFAFLRDKGVLNRQNEPYQRYIEARYFRQIESKWEREGTIYINRKTVVFQKGLDFVRKLVKESV